MKKKNSYKQFTPYVVLVVVIAVILLVFGLGNNKSHDITYNELLQYLSENKVTEITTSERRSDGVLYITGKLSDYQSNETFSVNVPNTEITVETFEGKREVPQFKCEINWDPEIDCCECDECCPHYMEETIGVDYTYDITHQTITTDSYMKVVITCHKDSEKCMVTTTTNTNKVFVNTYIAESTATRHHPNRWEWRCVNQLTLERG